LGILFIVLMSLYENRIGQKGGEDAESVDMAMEYVTKGCPHAQTVAPPEYCIKLYTVNPTKSKRQITADQCQKVIQEERLFSYYAAAPHSPFRLADTGDCYVAKARSDGAYLLESVKYRDNFISAGADKRLYLKPNGSPNFLNGWLIDKGLNSQDGAISIRLATNGKDPEFIATDKDQLVVSRNDGTPNFKDKSSFLQV